MTIAPEVSNLQVTEVEPHIALVELARGKVNAIDPQTYDEIGAVFDALSDDERFRVIVLTGQGRVFCAGNDLTTFQTMNAASGTVEMRRVRRAFFRIRECALPVIAAVNGAALGSGLALAAVSDLVVASVRASFGLPEMQVGVLGGGRFTRRMVPEQAMRRLFFTAEAVDAPTFQRWGAPIEVVDHDKLLSTALDRARTIAAKSRHAIALAKESLNGCEDLDLRSGYELEQGFTVRLSEHPDSKAALESRITELADKRARG